MIKKLRTKLKNPFIREVLLAIVLFCLPFLLWGHVLFSDEASTVLRFFNWEYRHGYNTDYIFAWFIFLHLIPIVYLTLFFFYSQHSIRYLTLPLLLCLISELVSNVVTGFEYFSGSRRHLHLLFLSLSSILLLVRIGFSPSSNVKLYKDLSSFREIIFSLMILGTLFFLVLYRFLFNNEETMLIFGLFKIHSHGFANVVTFVWVLLMKVVIFLPTIIWFLDEKKWWKYALLSPILITVYQIQTIFNPELDTMDEYEILQALPLLGLVLIILLALSKNAKEQYLFQAIYQKTYARYEKKQLAKQQQKQEDLAQAKAKLETLKTEPHKKDMEELLELKRQLEQKLSDKS